MNILIIGLGSMGKRRIRNLNYIQINYNLKLNLFGYDKNFNRLDEVNKLFKINCYKNYNEIFELNNINLIIISTGPVEHEEYIFDAINKKIKFFVEAGVFNNNTKLIERKLLENNLIGMPSSTMIFHPAVICIKNIINENKIGKISNIFYHAGQYLPDWHTYEKVSDFYVSKKDTGGAREILPYELTWLIKIFGFPNKVLGNYKKTINIKGAENIDDTYNAILDYDSFSMNIIIDVVSRYATRYLLINGSEAQLVWSWDKHEILIKSNSRENEIESINYKVMDAEKNYNKNITEEMYINEMKEFINYNEDYTNNIVNNFYLDNGIIDILNKVESSYDNNKIIKFINISVLIHIRLESTRLKEKHLKKINEISVLEHLILRIKNKVDNLNNIKIILNISTVSREKYYSILQNICVKYNVYIFFGNDDNIPKRINECCDYYGLTHVISIDGDDILVSSNYIENIYNEFMINDYNYIYTENLPIGMNLFGFTKKLLENCLINSKEKNDIDWGYIFDKKYSDFIKKKKIKYNCEIENINHLRFTLDYQEDFLFFKKILENKKNTTSDENIIKFVNENKLYKINEMCNKKWIENKLHFNN